MGIEVVNFSAFVVSPTRGALVVSPSFISFLMSNLGAFVGASSSGEGDPVVVFSMSFPSSSKVVCVSRFFSVASAVIVCIVVISSSLVVSTPVVASDPDSSVTGSLLIVWAASSLSSKISGDMVVRDMRLSVESSLLIIVTSVELPMVLVDGVSSFILFSAKSSPICVVVSYSYGIFVVVSDSEFSNSLSISFSSLFLEMSLISGEVVSCIFVVVSNSFSSIASSFSSANCSSVSSKVVVVNSVVSSFTISTDVKGDSVLVSVSLVLIDVKSSSGDLVVSIISTSSFSGNTILVSSSLSISFISSLPFSSSLVSPLLSVVVSKSPC